MSDLQISPGGEPEVNTHARLTRGHVPSQLIKLTLPMIIGIVAMVMFNLVDTYFVGQLGTKELAAMGFTLPVVMVISSIAFGMGVGSSSVISRAIGQGNQGKVRRLTTDALFLSIIIVVICTFIGLLTIKPLFRLLGAKNELLPLIEQYMFIWYTGVPFVVIPMVGNNAIRATGDTRTPSMIMLVAVFANMILDPLLIFGIGPFPRLELAGAALATVITRAITFAVSLYVLYAREKMLTFVIPRLKEMLDSWKSILRIGIPMSGTNLIMPVSMGIVTKLVSQYGPYAVAGFGVSFRIEMFAMTPIMAMSSVIGPFAGQNYGAGLAQRMKEGIRFSFLFSMLWGGLVFIIFLFIDTSVAQLFNKDERVITIISQYMLIASVGYGFFGIISLSSSFFNAVNRPLSSTILSILRMFMLYIPLAHLGAHFFQVKGIFAALVVASFVTAILAIILIKKFLHHLLPAHR